MRLPSDSRLYASTIAIVSGIYSIASAAGGMDATMPMAGSVMLLIGVAVLIHGTVLLTPLAERLGRLSGPLMVLWATVMIGNQIVAAMSGGSMRSMTWDGGMVGLAALMLVSGLIMSRARRM